MAQPRIAHKAPSACAACYQGKPDTLHIDYRAALEGRLADPSQPRGPHVDWVIICEDCLRNGLALLPDEANSRVQALEQQLADTREQLAQTQAFADRLEDTLAHRPSPAPKQQKAAKPAQRRNRYAQDSAS